MLRLSKRLLVIGFLVLAGVVAAREIGEERVITFHVEHNQIGRGYDIQKVIDAGEYFFQARFSELDGQGRPGSTGAADPTRRTSIGGHSFLRTSGPDANSCMGCHNQPSSGGGGDFVANVFVGAQEREPVLLSINQQFSAERGTTGMFGAGLIELLAREMTGELLTIEREAKLEAATVNRDVRRRLVTKGIDFGVVVAHPDGNVSKAEVTGVDKDLVIRPWSQKGTVTSLRTFTITALNQHHGLQASERFGISQTGDADFDRDGISSELTEGDITALVLYQASLPAPYQEVPQDRDFAEAVKKGTEHFKAIGCVDCHRTELPLTSLVFEEPGPYNLEGTIKKDGLNHIAELDLGTLPWTKDLRRDKEGRFLVPCFTDLKRHVISDEERPFFGNESIAQGFAPTDQFLTRRLWGVGSTAPYGHRGDLTTIRSAILMHGGEARESRMGFESLSSEHQKEVIEFLLSLKISPSKKTPQILSQSEFETIFSQTPEAEEFSQKRLRLHRACKRVQKNQERIKALQVRITYERKRAGLPTIDLDTKEFFPSTDVQEFWSRHRDYASIGIEAESSYCKILSIAEEAFKLSDFAHPPEGERGLRALPLLEEEPTIGGMLARAEALAFASEQVLQEVSMAALRAESVADRAVKLENVKRARD